MSPGRREDAGQATVELALLLPLVVTLALVVVQVALVVRAQLRLEHAAREGARAAAVEPQAGVARRAALASSDLDPARVEVSFARRRGEPDLVLVTVRAPMWDRVPVVGALLGAHELEAVAAMAVEPGS